MSIFDFNSSSSGDVFDRVVAKNRSVDVPEFDQGRSLKFPLDALDWIGEQIADIDNERDPDEKALRIKSTEMASLMLKAYIAVEIGARQGLAVAARGYDVLKEGEKHGVTYGMAMFMALEISGKKERERFANECLQAVVQVADLIKQHPQLLKNGIIRMLESQETHK